MNYKELTGKKNPFEGLSSDEKRRLIVYFGYVAVPSVPMDEIKRRWGAVLKDDEIPTTFEALEMVEIIKREVLAEENIEKKTSKKSGCFARLVFGLLCVATGIVIGIAAFPYVQQNLQKDWKMLPDETKETDEEIQPPSSLPVPKRVPKHGEVAELTLPGGEKIEMIYCAPGTFLMGSPRSASSRDNDETQHRVSLTKGFWLSKYKVTQAQWRSVMGGNAYQTSGLNSAMSGVSWEDCFKYVAKINSKLHCEARIPTEAEWEYACRASSLEERTYSGDANGWGFIGMNSGELEWCFDCYRGDFSVESAEDPIIDKPYYGQDDRRVVRGGNRWHSVYNGFDGEKYSMSNSRFADRLSAPPTAPYVLYCEKYMGKEAGYADPGASDRFQPSHECYIGFRLCCSQLPSEQ